MRFDNRNMWGLKKWSLNKECVFLKVFQPPYNEVRLSVELAEWQEGNN